MTLAQPDERFVQQGAGQVATQSHPYTCGLTGLCGRHPQVFRWAGYVLIGLVALDGLQHFTVALLFLQAPYVYFKDFVSPYLLGSAVLHGVNPYLPLPMLADMLIGPGHIIPLAHPTPHPPLLGLVSLPLALLPYDLAALAWFGVDLACLALCVRWLLQDVGLRLAPRWSLIATLVIIAWRPVWEELLIGQYMLPLLALLILAWRALRSNVPSLGGALLGLVLALKLMGWPILLFLLVRRSWRATLAAGSVALAANLAAAALMGVSTVVTYYLKVGPAVSNVYRDSLANYSLWAVAWRLLQGTRQAYGGELDALPLLSWSGDASHVAWLAPALLLLVGLQLALRARYFDTAFGLLVCVTILVNPVAWSSYLVLATIPLVIAVRRLAALHWPRLPTLLLGLVAALSYVPIFDLRDALLLLTHQPAITGRPVPFVFDAVTFLPMLVVLGLFSLVWHVDRDASTDTHPLRMSA